MEKKFGPENPSGKVTHKKRIKSLKKLGDEIPIKIIDTDVKDINDEYVSEKIKIPMTPRNPKNMALPKGVKSHVDYTKLFLSQELEGEVLDEKIGAFVQKGMKMLSKVPIRKVGIGGVGLGAITGVGAAIKSVLDKRREKKIKQDVDKYVSDRQLKGGPKKVEYKPNDQYTVTRDEKGKVTGTGKLIRVQPGTRTIMRMPEPGERTSTKSRFSQYTGSPFKASPLNKNKNIYGLSDKKEKTPLQKKYDLNKILEATLTKKQIKKRDEIADSMSKKELKKRYGDNYKNVAYGAATNIVKNMVKDEYLPEILDKKDVPHVKKLVKKLRDGSKTHAKQADDLEVALKTENTAIESELLIQDWNKDDIKFTEVEAIDIIKPEPLKPTRSNWREDLDEDWQKVNRKDKTDGLSKKAVKAYRRENPGSKLQTAVTTKPSKLKKGSKSAKRRLSFCRRMKGMKKKLTSAKTRRDPDSRINKALMRWNC